MKSRDCISFVDISEALKKYQIIDIAPYHVDLKLGNLSFHVGLTDPAYFKWDSKLGHVYLYLPIPMLKYILEDLTKPELREKTFLILELASMFCHYSHTATDKLRFYFEGHPLWTTEFLRGVYLSVRRNSRDYSKYKITYQLVKKGIRLGLWKKDDDEVKRCLKLKELWVWKKIENQR